MAKVHPLIFDPIFLPKIWGGRKLESVLGKALPSEVPFGESWEVSGLAEHPSRVRQGPAAGKTLPQLVQEWGQELYGKLELDDHLFPLLIKFIDARETLSVQVHPPRDKIGQLGPGVHSKDEAWYIIDAEPGAFLYLGLKPGVTREMLMEALTQNRTDEVIHRVPVRAGDCYYLPSGTVHAIGSGILLAEVQTSSDTTYRLHDFGRIEAATGKPRALHIDQALTCIDFAAGGDVPVQERSHVASVWTTVSRVATCPHFYIEHVRMVEGATLPINYGGMVIWMVLSGEARITSPRAGGETYVLGMGDVVLLPAALKDSVVEILKPTSWLETAVPQPSDLGGVERPSPDELHAPPSNVVQLGRPRKN